MEMETSNYLGSEKIGKLLAQFCIPCIASLIISCLYNIVDQIFVGNGVGYLGNAEALAILLDHGRIVESGDHDTLLAKKGMYYDLYMTQYAGIAT